MAAARARPPHRAPAPRKPWLQLRQGARAAAKSAAFGGVLLALIEGIGIVVTRVAAPSAMPPMPEPAPAPEAPPPASDGGGFFGGLFGSGKKEDDTAPPPMPDFSTPGA